MKTTQVVFGILNSRKIHNFVLENDNGMLVKVSNYGATINSVCIPTKDGKTMEVVCGFDKLEGYFSDAYKSNAPYFGGTVGRYASRVKDGKFSIDGKDYHLVKNDGSNHLHGGTIGFDKKVWDVEVGDQASVKMSLKSPHMEEGYPGNVKVNVTFTLTNDNAIKIDYHATTDQETPLSLTNHSYFNLAGFEETVAGHTAMIKASQFLQPDETNVPVGQITTVKGTALDLNSETKLGNAFEKLETGFETYYDFQSMGTLRSVAKFSYKNNGLEVLTTEPGMLFYTGYFTSDELKRESGLQYGRYKGFCCETHRFPNGPNLESAEKATTKPEEVYTSTTIFRFSW